MLHAGRVPPEHAALWGVPCIVKECFELPGMPFTAGIATRAGMVGVVASPVMQRVLDAGMPIIGTTNVSEACMFHESNNTVYGQTRNPFDVSRTAGGSSGGCGAGVASRMAPIAITSDVGGSTRLVHACNKRNPVMRAARIERWLDKQYCTGDVQGRRYIQ